MTKHVKVIFDRRKKAAKVGTGFIDICVYLKEGQRKFEIVGSSTPENWEVAAQDKAIVAKVKHYEQIVNAMKMLNEDMTIENFNKHIFTAQTPAKPEEKVLFKGNDLRQSFIDFCRNRFENEGLAPNTVKDFTVVFNALEACGCLNTFADLTKANVMAWDAWLRLGNKRSDYTINGYHKKVKKYTKILWQLEMIESDPYQYVKFPKGSNKERNPLTEKELIKIRKLKCTGHLERARDRFIFMAYTGLAFCDMDLFDFETMTEKRSDYTYIDGERLKTGSKFFTPILPPAMDVLKKYDYQLPKITNQKLNEYCHVIESLCQIHKPVTCHIGRHSFATLMLCYGFTLEEVKKMLGHKDIRTTQLYAKISNEIVEKAVNKKLKRLK
jgi:site-specific recombinase XerD